MPERRPHTSDKEQEKTGQIDHLSGVFRVAGVRRYESEDLVFVGWTSSGNPVVGKSIDSLSPSVRESYESFEFSNLEPKRILYREIVPAEYIFVGRAIDYKDTESQRAEDQVAFSVRTTEGVREIRIQERVILQAIVDAEDKPWQEIDHSSFVGEMVTEPREMYTLFLPLPKQGRESSLAILFKPLTDNESNRAVFKVFVQEVLTRLLALDEVQKTKRGRKGYLEAASEVTKGRRKIGLVQKVLRSLQDDGFTDLREEIIVNPKGSLVAAILEMARSYFDIDITDADIEMIRNPLPDYDLKSLDLKKLFDLAERMLQKAEQFLY